MTKEVKSILINGEVIRTAELKGEVTYSIKDISDILGIQNSTMVAKRLDEADLINLGDLKMVTKLGFYSIIMGSRKAKAKEIEKWLKKNLPLSIEPKSEELKDFTQLDFYNDTSKLVKTTENGEILFDAEKVAIGLGITDTSKGTLKVRWTRVNNYISSAKSGAVINSGDFITEPQFYKLAIKANNQVAERFQDWVTSEVLPSIRKNGAYLTDAKAEQIVNDPQTGLADLLIQAGNQLKEKQAKIEAQLLEIESKDSQIAVLKPKADYATEVLEAEGTLTTTQVARCINLTATQLNQLLNVMGVQFKQNGQWILYSQYQGKGYTKTQTGVANGYAYTNTRWTQKGKKLAIDKAKEWISQFNTEK